MKPSSSMINKTSMTLKKTNSSVRSTSVNVYQDVLQLMESIYEMRFIEKVSSPISKQDKGVLV